MGTHCGEHAYPKSKGKGLIRADSARRARGKEAINPRPGPRKGDRFRRKKRVENLKGKVLSLVTQPEGSA